MNTQSAAAKPVWTLPQITANLTRWDAAWVPSNAVKYSFLQSLPSYDRSDPDYRGFAAFTAAQKTAAKLALSLISDVANIKFVEAADNHSSDGRITFANSSSMPDYAWGWAATDWSGSQTNGRYRMAGSEIWVNSAYGTGSYAPGSYNFSSLIHEIGHAVGLAHPGEYNADDNAPITYANSAEYAQDSGQYTMMSYFEAYETGANHRGLYASTPLLHDVAALQALYGANTSTRSGATVYGFHSTADRAVFDFTANRQPIVAIWDGGGTDTIDLSGYAMACTLDLREGQFSNVGGLTGNLAVCFGAVIENGTGGSGADTINGNAVANTLLGGAGADKLNGDAGDDVLDGGEGADILNGGAGLDTASYASATAAVKVNLSLTGSQNTGGGGADTLQAIENLTGSAYADTLTGNSSANLLIGGGGDDVMDGGGGADVLFGGLGRDTLKGGAANDVFRFEALNVSSVAAPDLISDFARGDKIDLSAIDAIAGTALNDAFHLDGTIGGQGDIGVTYDAANHRTVIDLYVDNNATVDARIWVSGTLSLSTADFVL